MKAACLFAVPFLALVGCAPPAPVRCPDPAPAAPEASEAEGHDGHHGHGDHAPKAHDHGPPEAEAGAKVFAIAAATSDKPIYPQVLHEDDEVKIAVVTIQPGATMPEHATPVPVTVQTVAGTGTMTVAGEEHALAAGNLHMLDAGAPHALMAGAEAPLVVLVHYLKRDGVTDDHAH